MEQKKIKIYHAEVQTPYYKYYYECLKCTNKKCTQKRKTVCNKKKTSVAKAVMDNNSNAGNIIIPYLKFYIKATVINMAKY